MKLTRPLAYLVVVAAVSCGGAFAQVIEPGGTIIVKGAASMPASQPTSQAAVDDATSSTTESIVATTGPATRPTSMSATMPAKTLDDCRKLYRKGYYSQAAEGFRKLGDGDHLAAAIGLSQALSIEGNYSKAREALVAVSADGEKSAEWHVAMYEVLSIIGEYDQALEHAAKARQIKPVWAPAIYANGAAMEMLGRKDGARAVYKTMDRVMAGDAWKSDAPSLVALGKIMDRESILTQKKASDQATNILQNYLQEAYLKADKEYWPANVEAGVFLLNNHRPHQAMTEFGLAGKINSRIPDVFVGRGTAALSVMNFEECLKQAEAALAINPNDCDALLLKAECMMQWRKFDQVQSVLDKVLEVNPKHLDGLSMMAALHIRLGQNDLAAPFIARVKDIDPDYAGLPTIIGETLTTARQYADAEPYFKQAIAMAPELAAPKTALGEMYLQTGQEDKALETLKDARKLDDFREDVANYINLLNKMLYKDAFLVKETDHFVVKVDKDDAILLDLVSDYMEGIYDEVCQDYDFQLPGKTYIEFFPTHQDFSVRLTGRAGIPTVGACTGNVIAMSAPNKDRTGAGMDYNWAVVLKHEYTHAVTFAATNNRIPHWFTEACAVRSQPDRRSAENIMVLVGAVKGNLLLPVKDLDWGFIRPKTMGQRHMAYAESEWMLDYIIATKGYNTVLDMIKGFRDGMTQKEVFEKVVGMPEEEFDKNFQAWGKAQVKNDWHYNPDPIPDPRKLSEIAKSKPDDAQAQANWAMAAYNIGQLAPAEAAARKALSINPDNPKALAVLGYALMGQKKTDEAIGIARRLEDLDHSSIHAPKILAQAYLEKRDFAEAIVNLELLKQRQPIELFAYKELADLYYMNAPAKELPNLLELHKLTISETKYARRIAELYRDQGQYDNAMKFLHQITYINPFDSAAYEMMAAINLRTKRYQAAISATHNLCLIDPESAKPWMKLAAVQYQVSVATGDKALLVNAKEAAEKAVKLEPDGQAKQILQRIDDAMAK